MNSRAKGRRAERDVAKLLAKWWGCIEKGCEFKPTPLSGGWGGREGGVHVRAHFKASGDLMTTATRFPFTVEVKFRQAWSEKNLIAGKRTPPWDWWVQAQRQAEEEGGDAMLWFRKNNNPWMVAIPPRLVPMLMVTPDVWQEMPADLFLPPHTLDSNGVDYGDEAPAFIYAERILELDPTVFAKEAPDG